MGTGPGTGGAASKTLDKRRRLEEEAKNKVRTGGKGLQRVLDEMQGQCLPTHCVGFSISRPSSGPCVFPGMPSLPSPILGFLYQTWPTLRLSLHVPCSPLQAEEAMATYRTCVADAKTQKQELEDTKVTALRQIQEVIRQSDQTIKSVRGVCRV